MTHVDVRSMYPTILRDELFPTHFRGYQTSCKPEEPQALARSMGVIARVTIRTERPEYPLRIAGRVSYPVGTFTTTLAGPELLALRDHGEVIKCHCLSVYSLGRPFRGAMDALLQERSRAVSAGDAAAEAHAKLMANSLSGKLAQRSGMWSRDPNHDEPGKWGEVWTVRTDGGPSIRRRYILGICWKWKDDESGAGPYTSAYAYMTAYGRVAMRRIRDVCPARSVISQDTDGLWVLPPAVEALASADVPCGPDPGQLRVVRVCDEGQWWGPRHYVAGGVWVLAGFKSATVAADGRTVYDVQTAGVWGSKEPTAPDRVRTVYRSAVLKVQDMDGRIGPDGWVSPRTIRPAGK